MIDVNKIIVVDDIFPKWLQDSIDEQVKKYSGWKISDVFSEFIVDKDTNKRGEEWFCTKVLYQFQAEPWDDCNGLTALFNDCFTRDAIFKAIPDASIKKLVRIRLNGTFKNLPVYPHDDCSQDQTTVWTVVYYLNDSDGGTNFYHDNGHTLAKTVPFKKGSAVFFPSVYFHQAQQPVDHNVRITMALMYVIDSELNNSLFLSPPEEQ